MADEVKPRAVSGEIMTDAPDAPDAPPGRPPHDGDVIDADYVSLPPERLSAEPRRAESAARESPGFIGSAAAPQRLSPAS